MFLPGFGRSCLPSSNQPRTPDPVPWCAVLGRDTVGAELRGSSVRSAASARFATTMEPRSVRSPGHFGWQQELRTEDVGMPSAQNLKIGSSAGPLQQKKEMKRLNPNTPCMELSCGSMCVTVP